MYGVSVISASILNNMAEAHGYSGITMKPIENTGFVLAKDSLLKILEVRHG